MLSWWNAKAKRAPVKASSTWMRMYRVTRCQGKPRKILRVITRAELRKAPELPPKM
jgi:hypothetical protein